METQLELNTKRINLGNRNVSFKYSTVRKINYSLSVLFILCAIFYLFRDNIGLFERIGMSTLYLVTASLLFFIARIELSTTSKYAAHFIISETGLKIKTGVLKKSQFFNWEEIKELKFGPYKIGVKDKTGLQYFPYHTIAQTSIELKNAIEAMAMQKGIVVDDFLRR